MKGSKIGFFARLSVFFFIAALADVPVICGDEWGGRSSSAEDLASTVAAPADLKAGLTVVPRLRPPAQDSDCACPCHQNFGYQLHFALAPLTRLPEIPREAPLIQISFPARAPEHPPQNLL